MKTLTTQILPIVMWRFNNINLSVKDLTILMMAILLAGFSHTPHAQTLDFDESSINLPNYVTQSVIGMDALRNIHGRFSINMTAGDANVQANLAVISLGDNADSANAYANGALSINAGQVNLPDIATAYIGSRAFANSAGLISVNQSSGVGNAQANGAAFAMGFEEVVANSVLATSVSNVGPDGAVNSTGHHAVSIDDTAFTGVHGLVQVNQTAGSGNSTANNFALQVQLRAKP